MTPAALTTRAAGTHKLGRSRAGVRCGSSSGGGRLTLEQLLDGVWEGLRADGAAECPVCHGQMSIRPAGGACRDCGSALL